MKVKELIKAIDGMLIIGNEEQEINGYSKDTRTIKKDDLYIPLIGEKYDGHNYIEEALNKGAIGVITSKELNIKTDKLVIKVKDTKQALQDIAKYIRQKHIDIPLIAITGSVGKTSTKDMIAKVVEEKFKVLKTQGNENNEIGLPMTLLRYTDEDVIILEMGMNNLGEISVLTKIAQPTICIITNVGTAHIGKLGNRQNILKAKLEILEGLQENGIVIINSDNDLLHTVKDDINFKVVTYGIENKSDYTAKNLILNEENSIFKIDIENKEYQINIPVPGEHFILNSLSALAVGKILNMDVPNIKKGIEDFKLSKGRMDIEEINGITLIDGSYNANLDSMRSSINVLANIKNNRKVAILADMLELGDYSREFHEEIAKDIIENKIDVLITVGDEAKYIANKSIENGMKEVYTYENNNNLIMDIWDILKKGDAVLVKGSLGMNLKQIVQYLKKEDNK